MADPLFWTRAIHFASTVILAGTIIFQTLIAAPAIGRRGKDIEVTRVKLYCQLRKLAWAGWAVSLMTGAIWLVLVAASMSGASVTEALSGGTPWIVLTQTRFGEVWSARALIALVLAVLLGLRARQSQIRNWAMVALAAAFVAGLALAGHAGATPGYMGDLHAAGDALHLLAASAWVGGLIPLALFFAFVRRSADPIWIAVARDATHAFSRLGVISVGTIIVTGIINTYFLAGSVHALLHTSYGQLLSVKIGLFLIMVFVAAVNRFWLTPRLARTDGSCSASKSILGQLQRSVWIEVAIGAAVLLIVGKLGMLPPATHMHATEFHQRSSER